MESGRGESTSSFLASFGSKAHTVRELLIELGHASAREKYPSGKICLRDVRDLIREVSSSAAIRRQDEGIEDIIGINIMKRLFDCCRRESPKVTTDQLRQKIQSELAEECDNDDISEYIILLRATKQLDNDTPLTWKRVRSCLYNASSPPSHVASVAREPDRKTVSQTAQTEPSKRNKSHAFFTPEAFAEEASKKKVIREERSRRRKEHRSEFSDQIDTDRRSWQQAQQAAKLQPLFGGRDVTSTTQSSTAEIVSSRRRAPTPPHRKTLTPPGTPTPGPSINISQIHDVVKDVLKQLGVAPPPQIRTPEPARPDPEPDLDNTSQSSVPISVKFEQVQVLPEDASIWAGQECIQREVLQDLANPGY